MDIKGLQQALAMAKISVYGQSFINLQPGASGAVAVTQGDSIYFADVWFGSSYSRTDRTRTLIHEALHLNIFDTTQNFSFFGLDDVGLAKAVGVYDTAWDSLSDVDRRKNSSTAFDNELKTKCK